MNELQTLRPDNNDLNFDPEQLMKLRMFAKMISNNVSEDMEDQKRKPSGTTLQQLFEQYMEDYARPHCATWRDMERCYKNYLAHWSDRDLLRISRAEVQQWHSELGRRNSKRGKPMPYTANRALELLVMMYRKATEWELLSTDYNPGSKIRKFEEQSRSRFLQSDEVSRFFEAVQTLRYETTRDFLVISLLTGARRANVAAMQWCEIDFEREVWSIPRTKNGTPQIVPLVPIALQILRQRSEQSIASPWVFSSDRSPTGHLTKPEAAWREIKKRAQLEDVRIHDLRRTLASWEAITGANISAISATLNHKDLESTAIYARLNVEPVRKAMMVATDAMLKKAKLQTKADKRKAVKDEKWLSTTEASKIIGTPTAALYYLRKHGKGPAFRPVGRSVVYKESDLARWLENKPEKKLSKSMVEKIAKGDYSVRPTAGGRYYGWRREGGQFVQDEQQQQTIRYVKRLSQQITKDGRKRFSFQEIADKLTAKGLN